MSSFRWWFVHWYVHHVASLDEKCVEQSQHEWTKWVYDRGINYRRCIKCGITKSKITS